MNKFYHTRTYTFDVPSGHRKHYFFNLVERFGEAASFRLNDKNNHDVISATIEIDGDTETATFLYMGHEYSLRADRFIPKGYPMTLNGRLEKKDDRLKDAHLQTLRNREETGMSDNCGCICCQKIFPASEVEDYVDEGMTAICPYCDCDSLIGDASRIKITKELLQELNKKYF